MYQFTCLVLFNLILEVFPRLVGQAHSFLDAYSPVAPASSKTCKPVHQNDTPKTLNDKYDKLLCIDKGFWSLKQYEEGIPLGHGRMFMPVYSSESLTDRSDHIEQAVIWLHGKRENANKYFCDAMHHTSDAYVDYRTLTIVPWFSKYYVTGRQWARHSAVWNHSISACWSHSHLWMGGSEASNSPITAFGVLDKIVLHLLTSSDAFPKLNRIMIAGYSSGCQMLSRWSFFSRMLLPGFGRASVTALLGGCGTYMYLDDQRPSKKCSPLYHTGVDHKCSTFRKPADDNCQRYNHYGMSLDLNGSSSAHGGYLRSFGEYPIMIQSAVDNFPLKDVRFLLGNSDTCSCNTKGFNNPDTCYSKLNYTCMPNRFGGSRAGNMCCDSGQSNALPHGCGALLQGSNRLQRGLNYVAYLKHFYKERGVTYKPPVRIFDGAHDSTRCYGSQEFRMWAFEEGDDGYSSESDDSYSSESDSGYSSEEPSQSTTTLAMAASTTVLPTTALTTTPLATTPALRTTASSWTTTTPTTSTTPATAAPAVSTTSVAPQAEGMGPGQVPPGPPMPFADVAPGTTMPPDSATQAAAGVQGTGPVI